MYSSAGKYHYYNHWLVVDCDPELGRYYRYLVQKFSPSICLQPPMHGAHITVIAGKYESCSNNPHWRKYNGQSVTFQYSSTLGTDGTYFWLPVFCKEIEMVRVELGLTPCNPIPWHLTIGNLKLSS